MLEVYAAGCLVMSEHQQNHQQHTGSGGVDVRVKNYKPVTGSLNHHPNSSEDPAVASTPAGKPVSNARSHPRAGREDSRKGSNHIHNHVSSEGKSCDSGSTNGKRRRSRDSAEPPDAWTEHVSSSGRTYYYNKRLDKSQWERPKGTLKKAKYESTPSTEHKASATSSTPSGHRVASTPAGHKVASTPAGHHVASTPSGRVASTPSGRVASTPSGHKAGPVSSSSSGQRVSSSSGHRVSSTPSGHRVSSTPSGHRVSSASSAVKGSGEHGRRERSRGTGHSRSDGHGQRGGDSSKEQTKHQGDRVKGHDSRHHQGKSRSHSGSSSPPGSTGRSHDRSKPHRSLSGRSHGHGVDRTSKTPARASDSPVSSKGSGIQLISPTTPGTHPSLVTPAHSTATTAAGGPGNVLSHTLSTIIDHTSILLEQQHKLLAMETTPTALPPSMGPVIPGTPPSHHTQPLAKKKLSLTPQTGLSPSHPAVSMGGSATPGGVVASPQAVENSGLHPLQRALLLQNQKLQEMPHPHPLGGAEPSLQTPPTAIPHHMTPHQSCPTSPLVQSPIAGPTALPLGPATPAYSMVQGNMYMMPTGTPPTYDPSIQPLVLSSKVLQKPVSKLAYLNSNAELLQFPAAGGLERLGPSQVKPEQVDRGVARLWLQHHEVLARQVEQGRLETQKRRTVEKFYLSGQLAKRQVALAAKDVRITSTSQRARHLQALVQEMDRR